jgi:hypothetical protein
MASKMWNHFFATDELWGLWVPGTGRQERRVRRIDTDEIVLVLFVGTPEEIQNKLELLSQETAKIPTIYLGVSIIEDRQG